MFMPIQNSFTAFHLKSPLFSIKQFWNPWFSNDRYARHHLCFPVPPISACTTFRPLFLYCSFTICVIYHFNIFRLGVSITNTKSNRRALAPIHFFHLSLEKAPVVYLYNGRNQNDVLDHMRNFGRIINLPFEWLAKKNWTFQKHVK